MTSPVNNSPATSPVNKDDQTKTKSKKNDEPMIRIPSGCKEVRIIELDPDDHFSQSVSSYSSASQHPAWGKKLSILDGERLIW